MTTRDERIARVQRRFAASDPDWWFLITDDDDRVYAEGRPAAFVEAFMSVPPPADGKFGHYHIAWIRVPVPDP